MLWRNKGTRGTQQVASGASRFPYGNAGRGPSEAEALANWCPPPSSEQPTRRKCSSAAATRAGMTWTIGIARSSPKGLTGKSAVDL